MKNDHIPQETEQSSQKNTKRYREAWDNFKSSTCSGRKNKIISLNNELLKPWICTIYVVIISRSHENILREHYLTYNVVYRKMGKKIKIKNNIYSFQIFQQFEY